MSDSSQVREKIAAGNSWYIESQLANLGNPAQVRTIKARWDFFARLLEERIRACAPRRPRVLDAGCGDGINLKFFLNYPEIELVACDYNPLRVERARLEFPGVTVLLQDLTALTMEQRDFDLILCSQVLEHIPDDRKVLAELTARLATDGVLVVGVPNEGCLIARLRNHYFEPEIGKHTDHVHFYRIRELRRKFRAAGLRVTRVMAQNIFLPRQSMNYYLAARPWGFHLMQVLRVLFPSQAAAYYFALRKRPEAGGR